MMEALRKFGVFIRTWALRLLPVLGFAVLGGIVSIQIDRHFVQQAPGEDFLNYTQFTVNNAREGEDVNFTLCRDHRQNYNVNGNLNVYVIRSDNDTPYQVFARDVNDQVTNECDNKEITASDFHHEPGLYEMRFCVDFTVKYNIQKTVCKESNRYKIYAQPEDILGQIERVEGLLSELKQQQQDSIARRDTSSQSSNVAVQDPNQQTEQRQNPATPPNTQQNPEPVACLINRNVLGLIPVKIACETR